MLYRDKEHEQFYKKYAGRVAGDRERMALFYALGICADTRNHIRDLYNFETGCVKVDGIGGWITTGSYRIVRLAFNLFNGSSPLVYFLKDNGGSGEDVEWEWCQTSPANVFCDNNLIFMLEAVKIRYSDYLEVGD